MPLRILVAHPGADYSVADVHTGLVEALARAGHEVGIYALNGHLEVARRYLAQQNRILRKADPTVEITPTVPAMMLKASEGLLLTALRGRADAVLVISAMYLHPQVLYMLRAARIPVGLVFTESPYLDDDQLDYAGLASVCWTNERTSVEFLRQANPRTHYLPAAYRAGVHAPGEPGPDMPRHDVVFVGTYFDERADLLGAVDWSGIDLGLYGNFDPVRKGSRRHKRLAPYIRGGVTDNARTLDFYRAAKIGLNPFRTSVWIGKDEHVTGESANPRTWELAASGCFHLSGDRAEVRDVFGPAVPTFDGPADLEAKVRHYLAHDLERRVLADEARRRALGHDFDARAAQITEQLADGLLRNPYAVPARAGHRAIAAD